MIFNFLNLTNTYNPFAFLGFNPAVTSKPVVESKPETEQVTTPIQILKPVATPAPAVTTTNTAQTENESGQEHAITNKIYIDGLAQSPDVVPTAQDAIKMKAVLEQFSFVRNTQAQHVKAIASDYFDVTSNNKMSIQNDKFWKCGGAVGQLAINEDLVGGKTVVNLKSKVGDLNQVIFMYKGCSSNTQIEFLNNGQLVKSSMINGFTELFTQNRFSSGVMPKFNEIRITSYNDSFVIDEIGFQGAGGKMIASDTNYTTTLNAGDVLIADGGASSDLTPRVLGHLDHPLQPGQFVQICRDGVAVGRANVNQTNWSFQETGSTGLGKHSYTAQVMDDCDCAASCETSFNYESICYTTVSPLAIDLNGDGVKTISVEEGVKFDLDGHGDLEQAGWVDRHDGLLVLDVNHNGKIDSGKELFGNFSASITPSKEGFESGWDALKQYDSNHDQKISKKDAIWSSLKIWVDANSDGISLPSELKTLAKLGIKSINLNHDDRQVDDNGNQLSMFSTVEKTNGQTLEIVDAYFQTSNDDLSLSSGASII